jgi:hypothetical protein
MMHLFSERNSSQNKYEKKIKKKIKKNTDSSWVKWFLEIDSWNLSVRIETNEEDLIKEKMLSIQRSEV